MILNCSCDFLFFSAIYLTTTMLLGATSLSMSIMVLNIHYGNKQRKKVPRWVQVIILSLVAGILCMRTGSIKQHMRNLQKRREAERRQRESDKETSQLTEICADSGQESKPDSPIPQTLSERRLSYSFEEPDWRDVSRVLDRMFFVLVLMAMLVSSALTLCAPYYASS